MDGSKTLDSRNNLVRRRGACRAAVVAVALATALLALSAPSLGRGRRGALEIVPERNETGAPLDKFAFQPSDEARLGRWSMVDDASAGSAIQHSAAVTARDGFPLAIYKSALPKDFDLKLRLKAVAGRAEQSGVAMRLVTPNDYYLVQVDAHRDTVSFSRVNNGLFAQIASVEADVFQDRWQSLSIRAEGESFTVWLDGAWLFTAYDRALSAAGRVALWTRPESITRFDDIELSPSPPSEAR